MTTSKGKSTTQYLKIIRAWPRIKAHTDILKTLNFKLVSTQQRYDIKAN